MSVAPTPIAAGQTRLDDQGQPIVVDRRLVDGRWAVRYPRLVRVAQLKVAVLSDRTILSVYPTVRG